MSLAIEDRLHRFRSKYRTSPEWFKRSAGWLYSLLPEGLRYGPELRRHVQLLNRSQWWGFEQHRQFQLQQLRELCSDAYRYTRYYREVFERVGLKPEDIRQPGDIEALPFLTKELINQRRDDFVASNCLKKLVRFNTGGSTGVPLEFFWERGRTRARERAFLWRQWGWAGFKHGQRSALLRGQTVKGLWQYDPIDNQLFLSSYQLSEQTAPLYLKKLRRFRPVSIQAYPSTITLLATWMKETNEPPIDSLKVILCASENLYPAQAELLREVFKVRVFDSYGRGECGCMAAYCEKSDLYHVFSEYGYTELIGPDDKPVLWEPGNRGEIVCTGFNNHAMPFIRYRTGDIGVVGPRQCPCQRRYGLLERIEGGKEECVAAEDAPTSAPADLAIWTRLPPPIGGMSVHLSRLVPVLQKEGISVRMYSIRRRSPQHPLVEQVAHRRMRWLLRQFLGRSEKVHYVLQERALVRLLAALLRVVRRKKVILRVGGASLYHDGVEGGCLRRCMTRFAVRHLSAFIGVSEEICRLARQLGADPARVHHIPGFIPPADDGSLPPREVLDFIARHRPNLVACGQVKPWGDQDDTYGVGLLLDLMEQLRARGSGAGLVFYASEIVPFADEIYRRLEQEIARRGLADSVLVYHSEVEFWPAVKACDVMLRPSATDGDCNAVREAVCLKVPTVASDCVFRPAPCVLFRTGDREDFSRVVTAVLDDLPRYRQAAQQARVEENATKVANLIRALLRE